MICSNGFRRLIFGRGSRRPRRSSGRMMVTRTERLGSKMTKTGRNITFQPRQDPLHRHLQHRHTIVIMVPRKVRGILIASKKKTPVVSITVVMLGGMITLSVPPTRVGVDAAGMMIDTTTVTGIRTHTVALVEAADVEDGAADEEGEDMVAAEAGEDITDQQQEEEEDMAVDTAMVANHDVRGIVVDIIATKNTNTGPCVTRDTRTFICS
mmetsp:Transcript_26337/g.53485  ORF Transcript_26337/g.53485 Transcript_26337/m.53485 type:complete len:210 (-) Transcript_26337:1221-1850(-)